MFSIAADVFFVMFICHGFNVLNTVLCASGTSGNPSVGDSGGPLFVENRDGSATQIGIISWGNDLGHYGMPTMYTRVSSYINWIKSIVR